MSKSTIAGRYPLKQAVVSVATAASHAIVAPVAGKSIRLVHYTLVSDSAVDVTWEESGGTDRSGPMDLDTILSVESPNGLLWTTPGLGLNLLLGGAVQVSGHITYIEV